MSSTESQPAARIIGGRYQVGARRGSGLEVATFEAVDLDTGEPVVLKVVHPTLCEDAEFRRSFAASMSAVEAVHHPNLARVLHWGADYWNGRGVLFAVSEHLGGGSLRDLLDRGRLLSASQALMVGLDSCKALDALHRAGVPHGDIRPATLMFGTDGRLRVTDAGLAQGVGERMWAEDGQPTQERATYASPERALGQPVIPESDVYSLALVVIEAATGKVPFVGDSAASTLANRVDRLLPVNADLGPLAAVLERAARPSPEDRFNAAGFGTALLQAAQRMPRPLPIPTLSGSTFADRGSRVDPTGPLARTEPMRGRDETPSAASRPMAAETGETSERIETAQTPATVETADTLETPGNVEAVSSDTGTVESVAAVETPGPAAPETVTPETVTPETVTAETVTPDTVTPDTVTPDTVASETVASDVGATTAPTTGATAAAESAAAAQARLAAHNDAAARAAAQQLALDQAAAQRRALQGRIQEVPPTRAVPATAPGEPTRVEPRTEPARVGPAPIPRSTRKWGWIAAALFTVLLAGGGAAWWFASRPDQHQVPSLSGRTEAEALQVLTPLDFRMVVTKANDEQVAEGKIISTDPDAGTQLTEGNDVRVVVSAGPRPRRVPSLVGMTYTDAQRQLEADGLKLARGVDVSDEELPPGVIVSFTVDGQPSMRAGDNVARGSTIVASVSSGPKLRKTPQLANLTTTDATSVLEQLGLVLSVGGEEFSATVPKGTIIGQLPLANEEVPKGQTISVTVSKGPELVTVPNLAGLEADGMVRALIDAGLTFERGTNNFKLPLVSITIDGKVVSAGEQVPKGSSVVLNFTA